MSDEVFADLGGWLERATGGDAGATDHLFTLLYRQLQRLVRREAGWPGAHATLGATTLLHQVRDHSARLAPSAAPKRRASVRLEVIVASL